MPTLERQTVGTAFHGGSRATNSIPLPALLPAVPPTAPASPQPASARPRHGAQNRALYLLVILALLTVSAGMIYLSGYAQMTREKYRSIKLQGFLKQERDMQHRLQQRQAIECSPASIESKARALGMIPTDDKQVITVGQPHPLPSPLLMDTQP